MGDRKIRGWRKPWVANHTERFHRLVIICMIVVIILLCIKVVEAARPGTPPVLPARYQGTGNTLQALLNASWPVAQGPSATFTFFAPQNKAVKVKTYQRPTLMDF